MIWHLIIKGYPTKITEEPKDITLRRLPVSNYLAEVETDHKNFRPALEELLQKLSDHTGLIIKIEEPNDECGAV